MNGGSHVLFDINQRNLYARSLYNICVVKCL